MENNTHDGDQTLAVTASAPGFTNVSRPLVVIDDDLPVSLDATGKPGGASGGAASFGVTATGKAPLYYAWKQNGAVIPGATNTTYSTNNVQLVGNGTQYSCLVSNAYGTPRAPW